MESKAMKQIPEVDLLTIFNPITLQCKSRQIMRDLTYIDKT